MKPTYIRYRPINIKTKMSFVIMVHTDPEWLNMPILGAANWFWALGLQNDSRVGSYLLAETP